VVGQQSVGSRIGKFEIISRIGAGGMAEIFVARTRAAHDFEKIVALKRIHPHLLEDEDFVEMFLHEARLAARLQHPNIAQVLDIGDDDGVYFFTMEYILGQDLRRIVRAVRAGGGWLTLDQIITIVTQTAAGLHYAHEREGTAGRPLGIVHRDISPSNILISYNGGVKLVDFGIARAASRRQITQAGTLKGKIPYMSPEQCMGEKLDRRSDIYSLGIVLWELALCRQLWAGEANFNLVKRIATEDPPAPTVFLPNFPKDLERIIMRALARDRDERYATAQDFQIALEEFARERKLALSSVGLGRFMQGLFAGTIKSEKAALVEARASSSTSLADARSADSTSKERIDSRTTLVESQEIVARARPRLGLYLGVGVVTLGVLSAMSFGGWWLYNRGALDRAAAIEEVRKDTLVASPEALASDSSGEEVVDASADSPAEERADPSAAARSPATPSEAEAAVKGPSVGKRRRRQRPRREPAKTPKSEPAAEPAAEPEAETKPSVNVDPGRADGIKDPFTH